MSSAIKSGAGILVIGAQSFQRWFVFSFPDGKNAFLHKAVIHSGITDGSDFSKNVEVWTSKDGISSQDQFDKSRPDTRV